VLDGMNNARGSGEIAGTFVGSPLRVDRAAEQTAAAYKPLHRAFMLTAAGYYSFVTVAHFIDETGISLIVLAALSAMTALAALAVSRIVAHYNVSLRDVELMTGAVHLLILANILALQIVHYDPYKLVYFSLAAIAFALSSMTLRAGVASVLLSLGAMCAVIIANEPALMSTFIFVVVATGVTAIGLSSLTRGAIRRELAARLHSEDAEAAARQLADSAARLANADYLTGLSNRRSLIHRLTAHLEAGQPATLAFLDIDGFKGVNDAFGQHSGDRVLIEVGRRLERLCATEFAVHRTGGDEFALLAYATSEDVDARIRRLMEELRKPISLPGGLAHISVSVGVARSAAEDTAETLADRADYAAREAKQNHRGGIVVFSSEHEKRIGLMRAIERELLQAPLEDEIVAVFQPVVGADGEVRCYEALARWKSPVLGDVSPATFIPLAERLGIVPRITRCMLEHAIAFASRLPEHLRVSVNLSMHDLASLDSMRGLSQMLAAAPNRPCRIDFEITETAVMRDIGEAIEALLIVMAHGCRISLDDFGVGHSSLSRVQLLPLDRIKIDRTFVRQIETDRTSQAIVKTTLELCANLGISCVIEGVETVEQLRALRGLGATLFQGFLLGRPTSADHLLAALEGEPMPSVA
jgi:diguanylate cyclase (GGDEF)-like protein